MRIIFVHYIIRKLTFRMQQENFTLPAIRFVEYASFLPADF